MIHRDADIESIGLARQVVHDLFRPNPWIFWTDFLLSVSVGYATATLYLFQRSFGISSVLLLIVATCALYRVSLFMHEIVHFRRREMQSFKATWNIVAGIPMLTPSFFYESHHAHHNTHQYGTEHDGEYLPLGNGAFRDLLLFFSQVFVQPILVCTRFLLAPLTFLHPLLRQWTLERASSFVINLRHRREVSKDAPRHWWAAMDLACSARAWLLLITPALGIIPWMQIPKLYLLAISILTLNYVRTLAAHMYMNNGQKMTHAEQLLDSTTITGGWLTELLCPLGLRYHALHHLFPTMPYHNLGVAHRRLMEHLPPQAAYRRVVFSSYWTVVRRLLAHIRGQKTAAAEYSRKLTSVGGHE